MARPKTIDELLAEAEAGKSGATMGEQEAKQREPVLTEEEKKKKKRGFFQGLRDKRTILSGEND